MIASLPPCWAKILQMQEILNHIDSLAALNAGVEIFAALILAIILVSCMFEDKEIKRLPHVRCFGRVLACNIALLLLDASTYPLGELMGFDGIVRILYLIVDELDYVIFALFVSYITTFIRQYCSVPYWIEKTAVALCVVLGVAWALMTVFSTSAYDFDDSEGTIRGALYWLAPITAIVMFVGSMLIVFHYRRSLPKREAASLLVYNLFPFIGLLLQGIWDSVPIYLGITLALVVCYSTLHVEQDKRLAQKEAELVQSRMDLAVSQIQPHFLFNALSSICALCSQDAKLAQRALLDFSGYLRMNIDSMGRKTPIPFEAELKHVETYLQLEKLRYEEDLSFKIDVQATDFSIPALSVQPLVENAVKHGVSPVAGGGTIRVSTRETDSAYLVLVEDDGIGFVPGALPEDGRSHLGISNVRQRLHAMCDGELTIQSKPGRGTKACIAIPKEQMR